MKILEINNVDFSSYVNQGSYKVQNDKEYAAWVDGNRVTHRIITRQKVSGSFTMTFTTATAYAAFQAALAAATVADGYTAIKVYASNDNQLMTINAFVTLNTKTVWTQDSSRTPAVFAVTVKIEQR